MSPKAVTMTEPFPSWQRTGTVSRLAEPGAMLPRAAVRFFTQVLFQPSSWTHPLATSVTVTLAAVSPPTFWTTNASGATSPELRFRLLVLGVMTNSALG